ncbi:WYL domain-containing protein [Companilactobacillus formosensis]|uniref:WYL domain-containing protein n=1 Tax=Companilactobacillus formosensis TaxID=1617889 RepID=UPI000E652E9A|nr:WYL domain-containing protein [Companilactobacillus formosensis]
MEDDKEKLDPEYQDIKNSGSRYRILNIFTRFLNHETMTMDWATEHYKANKTAIQKDFKLIRRILAQQMPNRQLVLDKSNSEYHITREGVIDGADAIAILKMLIGTRAFSKAELKDFTSDILDLVDDGDYRNIKVLLSATMAEYKPVKVSDDLRERIRRLSECILKKRSVTFKYHSSRQGSDATKDIIGVPINMYFDTSYYYVMIYLLKDADPKDNPRIFRIDRFEFPIDSSKRAINIPYSKKVDEGTMLNKTHLLKMGNDVNYSFEYFSYPQTALDKLPGSRIVEKKENSVIIEGSIFTEGALLWIFSQGNQLKVLGPDSLVRAVKQRLVDTLKLYEK